MAVALVPPALAALPSFASVSAMVAGTAVVTHAWELAADMCAAVAPEDMSASVLDDVIPGDLASMHAVMGRLSPAMAAMDGPEKLALLEELAQRGQYTNEAPLLPEASMTLGSAWRAVRATWWTRTAGTLDARPDRFGGDGPKDIHRVGRLTFVDVHVETPEGAPGSPLDGLAGGVVRWGSGGPGVVPGAAFKAFAADGREVNAVFVTLEASYASPLTQELALGLNAVDAAMGPLTLQAGETLSAVSPADVAWPQNLVAALNAEGPLATLHDSHGRVVTLRPRSEAVESTLSEAMHFQHPTNWGWVPHVAAAAAGAVGGVAYGAYRGIRWLCGAGTPTAAVTTADTAPTAEGEAPMPPPADPGLRRRTPQQRYALRQPRSTPRRVAP